MKETFIERYNKLNEQQKHAVDTIDGPVLVIAGPGSGKTELLSLRVANILEKTDLPASSILCLTFTDAAAMNMQKRLAGLIGAEAYKVAIHTFHSFGTDVINRYQEYFYKGATYKAVDPLSQVQILEEILESLPHDNPLGSYSVNHGYTYLEDVKRRVGELKKGGLTPDGLAQIVASNELYLAKANGIVNDFFQNNSLRSVKVLDAVPNLIESLSQIEANHSPIPHPYLSLQEIVMDVLNSAYNHASDIKKTKPITEWKDKFLCKNARNKFVFKAWEDLAKHRGLVAVYREYQRALHENGYFDFDDMILDVVQGMQEHQELKFNLQERYQYILVDEFQDTNGVQMQLLDQLLDAEVNEGRPNILAVGDDDQAIYKFQGAKIGNIMQFKDRYRDPEIVVLTNNYRSTKPILELIRQVILKGENRLENHLEAINKELVAANKNLQDGEIVEKVFDTEFHEYIWVAEEIKKRMANKESLQEIAVIAPKHKILEEVSKYLDYMGIPIAYERKKNLLEQKHIMQLINMLNFVNSLNKVGQKEADELLPEILAYEFFDIPRVEIWKISVTAFNHNDFKNQKLWLEVMLEHEDDRIKDLATFFIGLAGYSAEWTGEEIIDVLTGVKSLQFADGREYTSPYKAYYFGTEEFTQKRDKYMDHLTALQALIKAVRAFKGGVSLTVQDLVEFVELHQRHNLKLTYETAFNNSENAVQLLSSHKAKGLEFETVYVVSCVDSVWFSKGGQDKLKLPPNIPLAPDGNDHDDHLRLFYVTLSRAKQNLFLTHHQYQDDGKGNNRLRFLEEEELDKSAKIKRIGGEEVWEKHQQLVLQKDLQDFYEMKFNSIKYVHHTDQENALLKKLLENYQLSVTSLNKFLDLQNAGPQTFIENNLLRFPQRQTLSLAYGNAAHRSMELLHREYKRTGILPNLQQVNEMFTESLQAQRLNRADYAKLLEKGKAQLELYYEAKKDSFSPLDIVERNLKQQGVVVNGAKLTGKLDKIKITGQNMMTVFDLKTGKPLTKWDNSRKANNYRDQLVFYKLLIENSRDYNRYTVSQGVIEFFEAANHGEIITLTHEITTAEVEEMKKLVEVVYKKIITLDFPDTSRYVSSYDGEVDLAGLKAFREDLLEGRI